MTIPKAMEVIRQWSILVDHDIPDDHIACLAQLISGESEKEKTELLKHFDEMASKTDGATMRSALLQAQ